MISSKTVNFNAEILNLVIFFQMIFFCESTSDCCTKCLWYHWQTHLC